MDFAVEVVDRRGHSHHIERRAPAVGAFSIARSAAANASIAISSRDEDGFFDDQAREREGDDAAV
jgi:hypothetical protein